MKRAYKKVVISCWFKTIVQLHSVSARLHAELDNVRTLLGDVFRFLRAQRQNNNNEPSTGCRSKRSKVITPTAFVILKQTPQNELYEQMYLSIAFQYRCVTECLKSVHHIISDRFRLRENLQRCKLAAPLGFLSVTEKEMTDRRFQSHVSDDEDSGLHLDPDH